MGISTLGSDSIGLLDVEMQIKLYLCLDGSRNRVGNQIT